MAGPLTGLRVLDLSRVLAGPWAGQCLADLGAEVIKVERPQGGDDTRAWGPPFFDEGGEALSAYFMCANRGKKSITVDIATTEGQRLIKKLAEVSDILIENFKVGNLKKYGLDYASLKGVNPALIYCSITGFGQTGPYKDKPGYDLLIQALGGLMSVTGEADENPGGGPQRAGVAVVDLFTGFYSTIGILGALHHRTKTGEGQYIDMALLDTQVAVLANQGMSYLVSGVAPVRQGNSHPSIVPYQSFATQDGHIILAVGNDEQFMRFCRAAGMPALADDNRFRTNPARVEHRKDLISILSGMMSGRTTSDWIDLLEASNVPCGPINSIEQVFEDAQVKARGTMVSLKSSGDKIIPSIANPIHYSATEIEYNKPPPTLGQDTGEVLSCTLKASSDDIDQIRSSGALG